MRKKEKTGGFLTDQEREQDLKEQEAYEQKVQDYMDWKYQHEEEVACRNEK